MMRNVVSLSVHRNTKKKRERRHIWLRAQEMAKDMPKNADAVALVWYRQDRDGTLVSRADYASREARALFMLPDLAKCKIQRALDREVLVVDDEPDEAG